MCHLFAEARFNGDVVVSFHVKKEGIEVRNAPHVANKHGGGWTRPI